MPRIYTSCSDPVDFCVKHMPDATKGYKLYGNAGDGPDGRGNCYGYEAEHPDYEHEGYKCEKCGKLLTDRDN